MDSQTTDNGTPETGNNATEERKLYSSRSEAEANKPTNATKHSKVFEISKGGAVLGYLWAQGYADCAQWVARSDGYKFSLGKTAEVTKEAVAAKLAMFTDAELAAMGLSRKRTKN